MKTVQSFNTARRVKRFGKQATRWLTRKVQHLADRNYHSARAYHRLGLARKKTPLLVYQMGKVGSLSLVKSLRALRPDTPIYHIHFLTHEGIEYMEGFFRKRFEGLSSGRIHESETGARHTEINQDLRQQIMWGLKHAWTCQHLRRQIDRSPEGKRWQVVTLVREPIARNVSSFFHLLDYEPEYKIKFAESETLAKGLELFLTEFDQHEMPLTWYDTELKAVFGIDVFASDFPKTKGYKIYKGEQADVLLLRLESLENCAGEAFKAFLNIDDFTLTRASVGSQKSYGAVYRQFLDSAILPDSYVHKMYTSRYARHFYSQEEINTFKTRWCRNA
jgi:hypothetical protein